MNSINLLTYLERRQLGYAGPRKNVYDMFIGQMGYKPQNNGVFCSVCHEDYDIGNTFACKFSRNRNNLHILGCSTEHGELIIGNTLNESNPLQYKRNAVHTNAIFNFAWAEPQMTLVTACGDQTSKLCNLHPSGTLDKMREFINVSSVKTVMFCPGSSDVFCGGCQDGSIKIWDARISNGNNVMQFDCNIPNAHAAICQYSGHEHETSYSKISISNDGRYLFSGCNMKTGVIWLTDYPYIKEPVFEVTNNISCCKKELSISDWCADSSSLKLAVSSDSMPLLYSILPLEQSDDLEYKISKTKSYKSKSFSKMFTVPIKPELKKIYLKESEENMEFWDFQNQNKVSVVDNSPVTPKTQWKFLYTKTTSPSASQKSPQLDTTLTRTSPVVSNLIPDKVTPVSSKKRKQSLLSPRCLIDQYLVPKRKREKMESVEEM